VVCWRLRLAWVARGDFPIRAAELPLKFITNTTRRPRRRIVRDLAQLGLQVAPEDVYTPAALAHDFLARRNLAPFLVVHPELARGFLWAEDRWRGGRRRRVRIATKPAMHSNLKPATYTDLKPATVPI